MYYIIFIRQVKNYGPVWLGNIKHTCSICDLNTKKELAFLKLMFLNPGIQNGLHVV